jgi:hypothetical protein
VATCPLSVRNRGTSTALCSSTSWDPPPAGPWLRRAWSRSQPAPRSRPRWRLTVPRASHPPRRYAPVLRAGDPVSPRPARRPPPCAALQVAPFADVRASLVPAGSDSTEVLSVENRGTQPVRCCTMRWCARCRGSGGAEPPEWDRREEAARRPMPSCAAASGTSPPAQLVLVDWGSSVFDRDDFPWCQRGLRSDGHRARLRPRPSVRGSARSAAGELPSQVSCSRSGSHPHESPTRGRSAPGPSGHQGRYRWEWRPVPRPRRNGRMAAFPR